MALPDLTTLTSTLKTVVHRLPLWVDIEPDVDDDVIEPGDVVTFWNDDINEWCTGIYVDLWLYRTGGRETSPYWGENGIVERAYIRYDGGTTYADARYVVKAF